MPVHDVHQLGDYVDAFFIGGGVGFRASTSVQMVRRQFRSARA